MYYVYQGEKGRMRRTKYRKCIGFVCKLVDNKTMPIHLSHVLSNTQFVHFQKFPLGTECRFHARIDITIILTKTTSNENCTESRSTAVPISRWQHFCNMHLTMGTKSTLPCFFLLFFTVYFQ